MSNSASTRIARFTGALLGFLALPLAVASHATSKIKHADDLAKRFKFSATQTTLLRTDLCVV